MTQDREERDPNVSSDLYHLRYLTWDVFEKHDTFVSRQVLERESPEVLLPFERKKKIIYVSHRVKKGDTTTETTGGSGGGDDCYALLDPKKRDWEYMKTKRDRLSKQFDGFWYDFSCRYQMVSSGEVLTNEEKEQRIRDINAIPRFIRMCYVLVVDPYEVYSTRFWMLWECLNAAMNRKLIINEYAIPLLKVTGTNPTFETVHGLLKDAESDAAGPRERDEVLQNLKAFYYQGARYVLIPVGPFLRSVDWESVQPVPLALEHVDHSRVLMISHRWETKEHPDPRNVKLKTIQKFLREGTRKGQFDYIFFDWKCIDQSKAIEHLAKINELYANSKCLCLCDGDYFQRSWCLFEICINKFNAGDPIIRGEKRDHTILSWLEHARLVQQMGYVHALDRHHQVEEGTTLELPSDQLHLKSQLRSLVLTSRLTNQGDLRIILNLLDKMIPPAPE